MNLMVIGPFHQIAFLKLARNTLRKKSQQGREEID
jgi:hypothetical protein